MEKIGVYNLKTHISELMKKVKTGKEYLITLHGEPIAKLTPAHIGTRKYDELHRDVLSFRQTLKKGSSSEVKGWITEGRKY